VHGYHPGVEDAEIYLPGVEKILDPALFPFNAQFFASHARLTLFPNFIASAVRISHISLDAVLLVFQFASIFLLLLACWKLSGELFHSDRARWCGVGMIAALLTLPVAGTALYILDQYTNPRNFAAFAAVFAITCTLKRRYVWMALWLAFAAAMHPLMSVFALSFCLLLGWMRKPRIQLAALLPIGNLLARPPAAYHEAAPSYFYILSWEWYEWLGILAPVGLLWWFSRIARNQGFINLDLICRALMIYDLVYFLGTLGFTVPSRFEALARLQPLRSLHLLYILLVVIVGGLLGEYVLKLRLWAWALLFVPMCAGMFIAQRSLFPASPHIEWSLENRKNSWADAFVWVRKNTPNEAFFALDPQLMRREGEDTHGFRAIAQRSMLADTTKDAGAVSMFPTLADEWKRQIDLEKGWKNFQSADFRKLNQQYGVTWVLLAKPVMGGLLCPYQNHSVLVCRIN
jgi:hypothetical protein